jgi:hypothetical protein
MVTNVPQDVIDSTLVRDVAKMYGLDYNKLSAAYRELLRAQRQQGAEPVAYCVYSGGQFTQNIFQYERFAEALKDRLDTEYPGVNREVVPLYTTPPQAIEQDKGG